MDSGVAGNNGRLRGIDGQYYTDAAQCFECGLGPAALSAAHVGHIAPDGPRRD